MKRKLQGLDEVVVPDLRITNMSTIKVLNSGAYHSVVRHIDFKNLWLIDKVMDGSIMASWISREVNVAGD